MAGKGEAGTVMASGEGGSGVWWVRWGSGRGGQEIGATGGVLD